jgi:hypothetical protein
MHTEERFWRCALSVIAGVLIGNVGWVLPSAAVWGGGWNIAACVIFPVVAVVLFAVAVFAFALD